ncbi:MAG: hypothetical protein HC889_00720 [Synechococcaceae cyanobacterium SM1_2_3]|nr:hypothetical protein [Synechococcaceae cyanobacterium SM1_2_3]
MSWGGGVGSGNLLLGAGDSFAAGIASITNLMVNSFAIASGAIVQSATNVAGSGAAITGRPEFYLQMSFRGTDYLLPLYRKA